MGFNVLYLPPISPIGKSFRKGKNNAVEAAPGDEGSPWAIGSDEGGHDAIHAKLGTMQDFANLVKRAKQLKMEVALDIAFQCAPDHPWVKEHPEFFKKRPDGSIQYAENPPKKYQDIYPLDFETSNWQGLWDALKDVFAFWMDAGVLIFRVDNPHTKAFPFWQWVIPELKAKDPNVLFLAEAFTRPRVMERLAKVGFSQSYTYFTWRDTKEDLTKYLLELTTTPVREYFRPNFWPNTPDILPVGLQTGGLPAFRRQLILAGTLAANYGMYGPAFELGDNTPTKPGSEEYLNSEKYEIKTWDLQKPSSLKPLITHLNQIRLTNPALQSNERLHFHPTDNPSLICYSKRTADGSNLILVVVNLDPFLVQAGWVNLDLDVLGLASGDTFEVYDLLADHSYRWQGSRNYVALRPAEAPAHLFRVMPAGETPSQATTVVTI
jgi:starch synthase (maltosyl-transferring)